LDDHVCGYIVAARSDARSVYMVPIHAVLKDIRDTLGAKQVSILGPGLFSLRDEDALKAGLLCDVATKLKPALWVTETHAYALRPTRDVLEDNLMSTIDSAAMKEVDVSKYCLRDDHYLIERANKLGWLTLVLVILNRMIGMQISTRQHSTRLTLFRL
jgi:hypothetical protein